MDKRIFTAILAIALTASLVVNVVLYLQAYPIDLSPHQPGAPTAGGQLLINGNVTVNAFDSYRIAFYVPQKAILISVSGSFQVLGAGALRVYIAPQNNSGAYYDSGYLNSVNISASLPTGGIYYLVYDNRNQPSNTIVDTNVNLSFYGPP